MSCSQSSEWGICGDVFRSSNVVKVDVFKKPSPGSTSVKFIFNPPTTKPRFGEMYHEPSRNYLDPSWISSMTHFPTYDDGGSSFGRRLMEADGAMVYADNQHSEPMLMCERGELLVHEELIFIFQPLNRRQWILDVHTEVN